MYGKFENVNSIEELKNMKEWTETNPMRVVTGIGSICNCLPKLKKKSMYIGVSSNFGSVKFNPFKLP